MQTPAIMTLTKSLGEQEVVGRILSMLIQVDSLMGGGMNEQTLAFMAKMTVEHYGGRPIGTLARALTTGVRSKVIGHKLTFPLLCEWIERVDAEIEQMNYNEYLRHK